MKVSKLKSVPLMTCCLVFALFAKSQGMDDAPELREVTSYKANHNGSYLDGLKPEISNDSQDKALLLIQDEEEEKSEASWVSYVTSPIKAVIDGTYNIVDFAVKHPTQAMITSLLIAAQYTSVVEAYRCCCEWQTMAPWQEVAWHPRDSQFCVLCTHCDILW